MTLRRSAVHITLFILFLCGFLSVNSFAQTELTLTSAYPTLGKVDKNLNLTLSGTGFDAKTRLAMSLDVGNKKAIIGAAATPGYAQDVAIQGDLAYVANDLKGLQIVDISDIEDPVVIGSVDTPSIAEGVDVSGDIACVGDGYGGFVVIDVKDPTSPKIIKILGTSGYTRGVKIWGDMVYVADGPNGLLGIDINDPQNPLIVFTVPTNSTAVNVTVNGYEAYVADGQGGMHILNITDPSAPTLLGSIDTPGSAWDISVTGRYAYVADYMGGLQVIDVWNLKQPAIINSVPTNGNAGGVTVIGNYAYVADGYFGITVVDISEPGYEKIVATVDTPGHAYGVKNWDGYLYVADGSGGLQIIDPDDALRTNIIGQADTPGSAMKVALKDDRAYVADNSYFSIVDIKDPFKPNNIKSISLGEAIYARSVAVSGNYVYLAVGGSNKSGLYIYDIKDLFFDKPVRVVPTADEAVSVTISGNYAYVAAWNDGLVIVDITIPEEAEVVRSMEEIYGATDVAVQGNYAYVANGDEDFHIVDISNPATPKIVGTAPTANNTNSVAVSDGYAYLTCGFGGLQIIDVSIPTSPQIINPDPFVTPGFAVDVEVRGDIVYVADSGSGVQMIDVSYKPQPRIIDTVDTPHSANGIQTIKGIGYVADRNAGLVVVPLPVEIKPIIINSKNSISCILPGPDVEGHYSLRAFNNSDGAGLFGAVSFRDFVPETKAIIVVGDGSSAGDPLSSAFQFSGNTAFQALIYQGLKKEDIYFLSPENSNKDVDAPTSYDNLFFAVNSWLKDQIVQDVVIYLVGHGKSHEFKLNSGENLTAEVLDAWLDILQLAIPGKIVLVYDACNSGSVISKLKPPTGKKRIIVAGSAANQPAHFLEGGYTSFSARFWQSIQTDGAELATALNAATRFMKPYHQTPWLDANGNGKANESGDVVADVVLAARGYSPDNEAPVIDSLSDEIELNGSTVASIQAGILGVSAIKRVWATVLAPDFFPSPIKPVSSLPKVKMLDPDGDGIFEADYLDFSSPGTYKIAVYAEDEQGRISAPRETYVYKSYGPDIFDDDDSFEKAAVIVVDDYQPQRRNFFNAGDQDWIKFHAVSGKLYTIQAVNLGPHCDVMIELFGTDGKSKLDSVDSIGDPQADERLDWVCPESGIYFVRFSPPQQQIEPIQGLGTDFDAGVTQPIALLFGNVIGFIKNALSGDAIEGATILTNAEASGLSLPNGSYLIFHHPGTYTVTARADGFKPASFSDVLIEEGVVTTLDFELRPALSDVEAFTTRFYQLCLDRDPDLAGLNGWVTALLNQSLTGSDVAYGFVFSPEFLEKNTSNEEYLSILYEAFFNRLPDTGGWDGWMTELINGADRRHVLNGFIFSKEFAELCAAYGILAFNQNKSAKEMVEDFVTRFYQQCLTRDPDQPGLDGWVDDLMNGIRTGADVAWGFIYSPEFLGMGTSNEQYLTILYEAFFNRDPDPGGWDTWLAELNNGADREHVLNGFIYAQEFGELCQQYGITPFR